MFRSVIKNTVISAVAFFAVSLLGIVLVPFLIKSYGVAGFGVIGLARLFIPLSGLGIFDLGFTEISTQTTAKARATGDWVSGGHLLGISLLFAVGLGLILGVSLIILAPFFVKWFSVPSEFSEQFVAAVRLTAIVQPILFASLVFEGIVKGHENFRVQRLVEVFSAVTYAGLAVLFVRFSASLFWICLAFLTGQLVRAVLSFYAARNHLKIHRAIFRSPNKAAWLEFKMRSPGLTFNKILGTAQSNGPSLLIGLILTPAAVGIFDALTRIPRFAKSVVGLINATIQPLAVRLEHGDSPEKLGHLITTGILLIACIVLPLYASAMAFSESILKIWLKGNLDVYWIWQALLFVSPAFTAIVGFGASALFNRVEAVRTFNRIALLQITIQFSVGLLLVNRLDQFSFVVGQVIAASLAFAFQLRLIAKSVSLDGLFFKKLISVLVFLVTFSAATIVFNLHFDVLWKLAIGGIGWVVCAIIASSFIVLNREKRHDVFVFIQNALLSNLIKR
ncbi:MAG TPA: oligosaccharide flippase family protein [Limnobacter sp.]|uniref:lipopolysaccharide biosynthesis protein n=1 Tax=Limnobacter sp. TaxID=2003368 RepID=UPI002E38029A|nr:oligosaccharide flippase family protein [Limnobacter sp.]HEX5485814.1 oligosaccharide flippase family protein [Limnobacter sp.]